MLELEVETGDWVDLGAALDSCSSSCLILLFIDSTSRLDGWPPRVDTLVELATSELDGWLETVGSLLVSKAA